MRLKISPSSQSLTKTFLGFQALETLATSGGPILHPTQKLQDYLCGVGDESEKRGGYDNDINNAFNLHTGYITVSYLGVICHKIFFPGIYFFK